MGLLDIAPVKRHARQRHRYEHGNHVIHLHCITNQHHGRKTQKGNGEGAPHKKTKPPINGAPRAGVAALAWAAGSVLLGPWSRCPPRALGGFQPTPPGKTMGRVGEARQRNHCQTADGLLRFITLGKQCYDPAAGIPETGTPTCTAMVQEHTEKPKPCGSIPHDALLS